MASDAPIAAVPPIAITSDDSRGVIPWLPVVPPKFFHLEPEGGSGGRYLSAVETPPRDLQGLMKYESCEIWSPYTKLAVEPSKTEGCVHIRSCFNNKYWCKPNTNDPGYVTASKDKPQEDAKSGECTLFRFFKHTSKTDIISIYRQPLYEGAVVITDNKLMAGTALVPHYFHLIDSRKLVRSLPSQVSFRMEVEPDAKDYGSKYLCSSRVDGEPCLRFEPGVDPADTMAAYELIPTADGNYSVKDLTFGKFWRVSNFNIVADAEERDLDDKNTKFSPVKVSDNTIALWSAGDDSFIGPAYPSPAERLCVGYPTVTRKTRLIVEERVLKREITNLRYRLSQSKIYNEEILEASHSFATNNSPDKETTVTLTYSLTDSKSNNWSNSESLSLGTKVEFETAAIPFIAKSKVELSPEFTYAHDFGSTEAAETKREGSYTVVVPPLTAMKVSLMFTKALCDVPYSYTQSDSLYDGTLVNIERDDGIYKGINSYDFYFESTRTDLKEDGTAVEAKGRSITRTYLV